jgi:hypothetical protein
MDDDDDDDVDISTVWESIRENTNTSAIQSKFLPLETA